ncbi:hypothetical protein N0V82_006291 [Gnomoniopsis sp. IMI 355080]|nr:hypothetical protein N0V82_006291 [Gnomoniopsis sp. IMI 355080]
MPPRLDPLVNTREEFTRAYLQQPIPDNADPKWKELNHIIRDLMVKLLEHEAMRENKTQPIMIPAINKNRVYFLWDSTCRILERWVVGCIAKSKYVASLMVDGYTSNPLVQMLNEEMAHGKETPALGEDITQLAQRIMDM